MADKADDSSDSDIFVQGGGPRLVSIYAGLTKGKGDQIEDDSDDEDDIVFISDLKKSRKKRGRGKREYEGPYKSNESNNNDVHSKDDSNPSKRSKISVFDSPSADDGDDDDDVQEVFLNSPYNPRRDIIDIEAERTSLLAKAALANDASEARIVDQVRLETQQENKNRDNDKCRQTLQVPSALNPSNQSTKQGIPILLKVQCESHVAKMRIRTSDPLMKMLDRFCEMFKLNRTFAVMEVDGENVGPDDTPETCDLEENMVVDVHIRKK